MRAVVMRDHELVVDTLPEPEPGPGEVLVETLACGICGSDLHALDHAEELAAVARATGAPFIMDPTRDVVLGHEFCAEILDHGANTRKALAVGSRVCSMPILLRADGVRTVGYSNEVPGGYAERMLLSEELLLPVPNGLPTDHAALTEPMAVGAHAAEMARLGDGDAALVLGCGPVGLSVIAALALRQVAPIIAADFSAARRNLAETLGAQIVIDPAESSPYEAWHMAAAAEPTQAPELGALVRPSPRPAVIFECVGVPGMIDQILRGAPQGARVVVVGVCMETDRIQPLYGINKEINLQFALGYRPEEFAATLRNLAEGRILVEPLLTARVGLAGVAQAFDELRHPERHAKILVDPGA